MFVAVRPLVVAGTVLAGACLAGATSVALMSPMSHSPVAEPDIRLTAGDGLDWNDLANIPVNLFNDIANIPYNLVDAPYSVEGLIPNFATDDQHVPNDDLWPDYAGPGGDADDDTFYGAINFFASGLNYTGSWAEPTATNVWGWDTANPWNFTGLVDALLPVKQLSVPFAENLNLLMAAESPIAGDDNKFYFNDPIGMLESQNAVPLSQLTDDDGYDLGEVLNPVGIGAGPLGDGGETYHEIWSETTIKLDPTLGLGDFVDSLTEDPSENPVHPADLQHVLPSLAYLFQSLNEDFNYLHPGTDSMLFQATQDAWGIPTALNGAINGEHGICPSCDDLVPDSVTHFLGGVLDDLVGPDSAAAQVLVGANTAWEQLLDGALGSLLPDDVSFVSDAASAEPAADLGDVLELPF